MSRDLFKWKRVAIDFDGTLVENLYNTPKPVTTDEYFLNNTPIPVMPGAAKATEWLREQGFEILIFTCRPDYHRKYMEEQLRRGGVVWDYILFYTKPLVDLYIDDKGFRFQDWETTTKWIAEGLKGSKPKAIGMEPQGDFEKALRKEKIKWLPKTDALIDIGCGSGDVFDGVFDKFTKPDLFLGIEPNDTLRHLARQKKIYDLVVRSAPSYIGATVTLLGVLEHVDDDIGLLQDIAEKGAEKIYITVPNANSFHRYVGREMGGMLTELGPQDLEVGHKRVYSWWTIGLLMTRFCAENGYHKVIHGTTSFKFTTSNEQTQFLDRFKEINAAAEFLGWVGPESPYGAEIFYLLERDA